MPTKVIGYVGKQIGMIELLWRRGFLKPGEQLPKKEACEEIIKNLKDFKNEKCEVKHTISKLDVLVRFTPKAHCELAGRGIEYI